MPSENKHCEHNENGNGSSIEEMNRVSVQLMEKFMKLYTNLETFD